MDYGKLARFSPSSGEFLYNIGWKTITAVPQPTKPWNLKRTKKACM